MLARRNDEGAVIGHYCETNPTDAPTELPEFRQRPPLKIIPAPRPQGEGPGDAMPARPAHRPTRCTAPGCRRLAVVDEAAAAPHCGAHQAAPPPAVEAARKAQAEASSQARLSELDRTVETLIRAHTMGSVLDAAWAASARISPWKSRNQ